MSATVTVSTSVILAPTRTTAGDYVVYFPNISTNGRLITVRDNDGFASTNHAVVLSTIGGAQFQTEVTATQSQILINQPFGFITLNSQTSGRYTILNTFAFPEGSAAAFVSKVTTNNLVTSTLQMIDIGTQSTNTFFTSTGFMYLNSSVMGQVSDAQLQSTVNSLGTVGYISTVIIPPLIPALYIATGFTSNQFQTSSKNPLGSIVYSQGLVPSPWLNATSGYSFGFSNGGNDVVVGSPYIVAVGDSYSASSNQSYIQTSVDGSNWNYATVYLSSPQARLRVSYANGMYHAVGSNGQVGGVETILWSRDGASWSNSVYSGAGGAANPFIGTNGYARGIAYGNGRWVTVGDQSNLPIYSMIHSIDGSNWNVATSVEANSPTIWDVAFNGTYFIALCGLTTSGGNILRSTDGIQWVNVPTTYATSNFNVDPTNGGYIAGNTSIWLLTASNGAPSGKMMWYSLDNGGTWNSNPTFASGQLSRPFWDGALWWIGYKNYSAPNAHSIYYSGDGLTWTSNYVGSNSFQGGFPQGFASRNAQSNFATVLFSTVVGLSSNQNISSLQTNVISTNSIAAATMTVSSLFVQVEVISTSFETINKISTVTTDNLSAGIAYLRTAAINSNTVNYISAGTETVGTLFATRIGINCNAPQYNLDVENTIRCTSNLIVGYSGQIGSFRVDATDSGDPVYPLSTRMSFGGGVPPSDVGWQMRIAANQDGTLNDIVTISDSGRMGINQTNPAYPLDVSGIIHTTSNVLVDSRIGVGTLTPAYPLHIRSAAPNVLIEGIGAPPNASILFSNASAVGDFSLVGANGQYNTNAAAGDFVIRSDSLTKKLILNNGGSGLGICLSNNRVGINCNAPGVALDVGGDIRASGNITAYSDERFKTDIFRIENALSSVKEMRGVFYTPLGQSMTSVGVIAQEMEKVLPQVVCTDSSEQATKSVAYGNITAVLIEAIKELSAKVDALSKQ